MDGDEWSAAGADEQGIAEVDIDLGLEQGGQHARQVGGSLFQFGHNEFAYPVSNVIAAEEFLEFFGIAHDDPRDRCFGGVLDTQGEDDHTLLVEHLDNLHQRADAVGEEDGILAYFRPGQFLDRLCGHRAI